jgi:nicotinate-nucleotide pyrophosphorylase (carboxylating)
VTFPVDPIQNALEEDIGTGDLTSAFLVPADHQSAARIFAKENAVLAGTQAAQAAYQQLDPQMAITIRRQDGDAVSPGDTVLEIAGRTRSILTGERVALNFIQRLSGVATVTRRFVGALEKAAVKAGGGGNHRMGLFDAVMVKDNHLLAHPSLAAAIKEIRQKHPELLIEVEADSIDQVREFVRLEAINVILLDNMRPEEIRQCVELRRPGLKFEASGGVSLSTVRAIAETGVDYISVGHLTHSAPAIDFSLELCANA